MARNIEFRKGEKVKYIGKGFISFDTSDTTMTYLERCGMRDIKVLYKNMEMLVTDNEIDHILEVDDIVRIHGKSRKVKEILADGMIKLNKELAGVDKSNYIIFNENDVQLIAKGKIYHIKKSNTKGGIPTSIKGTLSYLIQYFGYVLEIGNSHNKSINRNPKTIISLMINLQKAYKEKEGQIYDRTFITLLPDSDE